jgi:hypothetical protein
MMWGGRFKDISILYSSISTSYMFNPIVQRTDPIGNTRLSECKMKMYTISTLYRQKYMGLKYALHDQNIKVWTLKKIVQLILLIRWTIIKLRIIKSVTIQQQKNWECEYECMQACEYFISHTHTHTQWSNHTHSR